MRTVGIVSEYNPFHNGHKYHIETAKKVCRADSVICIMSGSFVQRGEPAVFDKWTRAEMALSGGADLVIELPFVFSCQPAEIFAYGAVKILNALNIVDCLCFGSESGDTALLVELAEILYREPAPFRQKLKESLSNGNSYPKAVSEALSFYLNVCSEYDAADTILFPNNVLGIEYIKTLMLLKSSMEPVAVKRIISRYNDKEILHEIAGATAIRNEIKHRGMNEKTKSALPHTAFPIAQHHIFSGKNPVFLDNYSDLILYRLRTMTANDLQRYLNVKEGIEHRLLKAAGQSGNIEQLIESIKTKRYTRTFIQRLLCHILLDLRKQDIFCFKALDCPAYVRVLGFNDVGKQILKKLKDSSLYPVITKTADFETTTPQLKKMFSFDLLSTDIYNLGYDNSRFKTAGDDFFLSPCYRK